MNKNGRPETTARMVREAVQAAGFAGATYAQIRAANPALTIKQIRHCTANNIAAGLMVRHGEFRHPRFFAPDVPAVAIAVAVERDEAERKARREALDRAQSQKLSERRKMERAAKRVGIDGVQTAAKVPAWWHDLVLFVQQRPGLTMREIHQHFRVGPSTAANAVDQLHLMGKLVCRMGVKRALVFPFGMSAAEIDSYFPPPPPNKEPKPRVHVKKLVKTTQAINRLADKFRGSASPKELARLANVVGMETAPRIVAPAPRGRYDVDPATLSGLSNLPLGVYAEPASRWAAVATDRRAA